MQESFAGTESNFSRKLSFYLGASLALNLLLAWNSLGFYHPDEQYYAIDFALLKLGYFAKENLTWEYQTQLRPWTLPFIFYHLLSFLKFLGLQNPFALATGLRLLSALGSWFCLWRFNLSTRVLFKREKNFELSVFLSHFLWVSLFMHARTSSENWATAIFLLGLSFLFKDGINDQKVQSNKSLLLSGLCFGLAFSLRHQMGLMAFTFGLWMLWAKRVAVGKWLGVFSLSLAMGVLGGILIDWWGYEELTLTPYNYLRENLLHDKISQFGVHPWWYYFKMIVLDLTPFFGPLLLIANLHFFYVRKNHPFTWMMVPFLVFHGLIGHKELRFLYPLFPLSLLVLSLTWENWEEKQIKLMRGKNLSWAKNVFKGLLFLNGLGVLFVLFKPAYTPLTFYRFLWDWHQSLRPDKKEVRIFVLKDRKGHYPELDLDFYRPKGVQLVPLENLETFQTILQKGKKGILFSTTYADLEKLKTLSFSCERKYLTYPEWALRFNYFNWVSRSSLWALHICQSPEKL